jgi:hypothetical protein
MLSVVWDETGIAAYFFPRASIPADIQSLAPLPDTWGLPFARWPSANCSTFDFFKMHSAIFDITLWLVKFSPCPFFVFARFV